MHKKWTNRSVKSIPKNRKCSTDIINLFRREWDPRVYVCLFDIKNINTYDVLIIDTPPSRNAIFVQAPSRMTGLF